SPYVLVKNVGLGFLDMVGFGLASTVLSCVGKSTPTYNESSLIIGCFPADTSSGIPLSSLANVACDGIVLEHALVFEPCVACDGIVLELDGIGGGGIVLKPDGAKGGGIVLELNGAGGGGIVFEVDGVGGGGIVFELDGVVVGVACCLTGPHET
ncbi:hypothetical protein Tco_0962852, partial [Tanacetum coccineum]